jgi:hypothetical protein
MALPYLRLDKEPLCLATIPSGCKAGLLFERQESPRMDARGNGELGHYGCRDDRAEWVCSTTPRLRAAAAIVWPDSTSRTASCLNSSVYLPRFPFLTFISLRYYSSSLRDTFYAGKVKMEIPFDAGPSV